MKMNIQCIPQMYSKAPVMFFFMINTSENLSNLACVSSSVGVGADRLAGFGFDDSLSGGDDC